jgi:hypothetical protein
MRSLTGDTVKAQPFLEKVTSGNIYFKRKTEHYTFYDIIIQR